MVGQLDSSYVLFASVVQLAQLLSVTTLHGGSLQDAPDVLVMGDTWTIVTIVETFASA